MKNFLIIACGLLSAAVQAQTSTISGSFGHAFTGKANEAVWTVKANGATPLLVTVGAKTSVKAFVLTKEQRKDLWDKLSFDSSTGSFEQADCIATSEEYICNVPQKSRALISDLKDRKSDFFHFDSFGGLMEINKVPSSK